MKHDLEHKIMKQQALIYAMGFSIVVLTLLQILSFYFIVQLLETS